MSTFCTLSEHDSDVMKCNSLHKNRSREFMKLNAIIKKIRNNDMSLSPLVKVTKGDNDVETALSSISSISMNSLPALHLSVLHGSHRSVQESISQGEEVNASSDHGWTPLLLATQRGDPEIVRLLLQCGVDVHASIGRERITSLHIAVCRDSHSIVQLLLEHNTDVGQATALDRTALHMAAQSGNLLVTRQLLQYGADPFALDVSDRSVLSAAEAGGHLELVHLVLTHVTSGAYMCDENSY